MGGNRKPRLLELQRWLLWWYGLRYRLRDLEMLMWYDPKAVAAFGTWSPRKSAPT